MLFASAAGVPLEASVIVPWIPTYLFRFSINVPCLDSRHYELRKSCTPQGLFLGILEYRTGDEGVAAPHAQT